MRKAFLTHLGGQLVLAALAAHVQASGATPNPVKK